MCQLASERRSLEAGFVAHLIYQLGFGLILHEIAHPRVESRYLIGIHKNRFDPYRE